MAPRLAACHSCGELGLQTLALDGAREDIEPGRDFFVRALKPGELFQVDQIDVIFYAVPLLV